MRVVVTGAAGFIGSNLTDALLAAGHTVLGIDNLSTGDERFLEDATRNAAFELRKLDLLEDGAALPDAFAGADAVVHLAANADVRFGWHMPDQDLKQNTIVTHQVLEGVRRGGVPRFLFSSTGSVYGEAAVVPTPEDCPFPVQTSLYGASKLAGEGLAAAYVEGCGITATVFRFVSILGPRYTHGHVVDFVRQLRADPTSLTILGDGRQRKSYLDVSDCARAVTSMLGRIGAFEVYNLGVPESCTVDQSAGWICERMGVKPTVIHTGGDRGWIGDNPHIHLAIEKMRATGWQPHYGIRAAVERTVDYLAEHTWIVEREVRR
ncbi:MAG TPA: NAD-dependent epimerase/dehydratase family protein [Actinomycetota bacterium]|nr:NAD-dependent epimerase/dehydratase family protein [Actinomycetota bacterium]